MASTQRKNNVAFFSGTFDPFTRGHESIVRRTLAFVDEVVVAIGINPDKTPLFTAKERSALIEQTFAGEPRVSVISYEGLTVDAAKSVGASCIVRGIRGNGDLAYEQWMAEWNRNASGIDTVMLFALPDECHISSSEVRKLISEGSYLTDFVPEKCSELLLSMIKNK